MIPINTLFDRMDAWRHLPNYQLERRVDIFFSLYLAEVLTEKLNFPIRPDLIPEFPVRIGTINKGASDKSYKIDYLALSVAGDKVVFVELKTERKSWRLEQDQYLQAARDAGLEALLRGVLKIFRATDSKPKYFYLLRQLQSMGLLVIPKPLTDIMARPTLQGANEALGDMHVKADQVGTPLIVYVMPKAPLVAADQTAAASPVVITFHEFAEVVRLYDDPVSQRFAASLCEWADVPAGSQQTP